MAIVKKEAEIREMVGRAAVAFLMGIGYGSEMAEVIRLIRELAHITHDIADSVGEIVTPDDEKQQREGR